MNELDPQLTGALIALGLAVIGGLTELVRRSVKAALDKLDANTALTRKVEQQTNGRFRALESENATLKNTVFGLRTLVRERDDRLAYVIARHPEVERTVQAYQERRSQRTSVRDEDAALERLMEARP